MLSCGDYDANAIMREAKHKQLYIPSYMKRYINIKKVFPIHKYNSIKKEQVIKNIKTAKSQVGGMTDMLSIVGLSLKGRHHSGVDDSINIARVCLALIQEGFEFKQVHIMKKEYRSGELK